MHIPPGGGPPPHRHDFEESFTLLEGELDATFRGAKSVVRASDMLCICSPAGQEEFFLEVGARVSTRTTALAPKYRTELLKHA